jgi:hypothetical protein
VHAFTGGLLEYHGKQIPAQRFHGFAEWRPDRRFLSWHYNQCLKAHIRGFSYGMTPVTSTREEPLSSAASDRETE